MIQITVRYFNILAIQTGKRSEIVSLPDGSLIRDLILHLAENNPKEFRETVLVEGEFSKHLRVFVNEKSIKEDGLDGILADGDQIMLFPAIAGG